MSVASRFAIEYPQRALQLIHLLQPLAKKRDLVGSFGLLAAAAVLTIPYERMRASHFLHRAAPDRDMAVALKYLQKVPFLRAPFWNGEEPKRWWQSRIVNAVEDVSSWLDEDGRHPLAADAVNRIVDRKCSADDVLRVLRNALAHGNIIYLDEYFRENAGRRMVYLAFLSRYEEIPQQQAATTYRLVVTGGKNFCGL